jgi:hypothetical protein
MVQYLKKEEFPVKARCLSPLHPAMAIRQAKMPQLQQLAMQATHQLQAHLLPHPAQEVRPRLVRKFPPTAAMEEHPAQRVDWKKMKVKAMRREPKVRRLKAMRQRAQATHPMRRALLHQLQ